MRRFGMVMLGIVVFLLEASVFPFFFGGMWQPDLWLTILIIGSLIFSKEWVIGWTLAGGFVEDLIISNYFGLHLFPYMVVAAIIYGWARTRFNKHWYVSVAAVMAGSLLFMVIVGVIGVFSGEALEIPSYFLYKCVPFMMMNGTAALFLHRPLWGMKYEGESRW